MSASRPKRSTNDKIEDLSASKESQNISSVPSATNKIFYIAEHMLADKTDKLKLERFFHPGKGKSALFITKEKKQLMEVLEFAVSRRSWLIDNEVCSNGRIYITTPVDVTFLALHHLRKHCHQKALSLDSIHDDEDPSVAKLFNYFVDPAGLKCIADVKTAGDMTFYKYNPAKAMSWLSLKTKGMAKALQANGVYCGNSAVSQNFARSEKAIDETAQDSDYLRMACDYVGIYIDLDLHEELTKQLKIPSEIEAIKEENKALTKRKSGDKLNDNAKKLKLVSGVASKVKSSNLLNETQEGDEKGEEQENNKSNEKEIYSKSPSSSTATPLRERPLSAKEKSLAKCAKGLKSISSFFIKTRPNHST